MVTHMAKLKASRDLIQNIIQGTDRKGNSITSIDDFFKVPEVMRQFSFIEGVLSKQIEYELRKEKKERRIFSITVEELAHVQLPDSDIGINEFAKCINRVIDISSIRGISGAQINSKLKEVGILGEKLDDDGKKMTVINKKSKDYGIISIPSEYNGRKYEKVTFNNKGKQFLLDHFIEIMKLDEVSATK